MHPLTENLANPAFVKSHPITLALLEMGAAAAPRETSRPARRKTQMRMLRQWRRLEEALADFVSAKVTDEDLVLCAASASIEPFYLENSGWLAPGTDPEELRSKITVLLIITTELKRFTTPPLSYFKTKTSTTMKAPQRLEDQFNTIVTSSEPSHTALDKFLRGSLRASNALANLLEEVEERRDVGGDPPSNDTIEEAKASLVAQGFTY